MNIKWLEIKKNFCLGYTFVCEDQYNKFKATTMQQYLK